MVLVRHASDDYVLLLNQHQVQAPSQWSAASRQGKLLILVAG